MRIRRSVADPERRVGERPSGTAAAATALVLGLLLVGACGAPDNAPPGGAGPGGSPAGTAEGELGSAPWRAFDPPARFDPGRARPLALRGVDALTDTLGWAATTTGMTGVDLRTGATVATVAAPQAAPLPAGSLLGPGPEPDALRGLDRVLVAELGGTRQVLTAVPARLPGSGTSPARAAVQLLATDPAQPSLPPRVATVDAGESFTPGDTTRVTARVAGATTTGAGPVAVVVVQNGSRPISYGLDPSTGALRWRAPGFVAQTVLAGGTTVGIDTTGATAYSALTVDGVVAGRDTATGTVRFTSPTRATPLSVERAGPDLVAVVGREYISQDGFLQFLDGAGDPRYQSPASAEGYIDGYDCRWDQQATTVCTLNPGPRPAMFALDATTGDVLWALPDRGAGRVAANVTAVFHGAVYATVPGGGPVVLDARTGRDRTTDPGAAPQRVNPYAGIVIDRSRPVPVAVAVPAAG